MKKILLLAIIILAGSMIIWSQVPQAMTYKAVAKDDWGVALPNKTITLRFTILKDGETGSTVYQETHTTTTNKFGLMDVEIGKGTPVIGSFDGIDWSTGVYYIQIEMDPNGGTNFRLEDPGHQLLSVPYALYAGSSGNSSFAETDPFFMSSPSANIWSTDISNWNTAFSWGNHANEGYLKSFTESDPVFLLHPAHGIASDDIDKWNAAYSWGNHASLYRPIDYVPKWNEVADKPGFAPVAVSGSYTDLTSKPVGTSKGDIQYWNGTDWTILPAGTEGQVLTVVNGIPSWGSGSNADEGLQIVDPTPYNGEEVKSNILNLGCTVIDPDSRPLLFDIYLAGPAGTEQVGSNLITPYVRVTIYDIGAYSWRVCVKDDLGHVTWSTLWDFIVGPDVFDEDGDGSPSPADCNDHDASIYPGAIEICGDGIDQDCDGSDLVCEPDPDADNDNFTVAEGDCNDNDASIYPGATEIEGDGIDQNCDGSDLNDPWLTGMLDRHNYYRTEYGLNPVKWSDQLAQESQTWADYLASQDQLEHSTPINYGENLLRLESLTEQNPTTIVDYWGSEKLDFDFNSCSCNPGAICGHYTNIMGYNVSNIGCGKSFSSSGNWYYVCRYSPYSTMICPPED